MWVLKMSQAHRRARPSGAGRAPMARGPAPPRAGVPAVFGQVALASTAAKRHVLRRAAWNTKTAPLPIIRFNRM